MKTKIAKKSKTQATAPSANQLDLDNHIPGLLVWVNNKFSADGSRAYRKMFGVGLSDWRVVAYLGVFTQGTAAQIGEFLGMDKAAVSRSVSSLKGMGYINAQEPDGRRIHLSLNHKGIAIYNGILEVALARAEALLNGLNQTERAELVRLLHKLHDNIPHVCAVTDEILIHKRLV